MQAANDNNPRTLTYDNAGRITAYTDTNTTLNQSFGYDANDRLTSWTGAWGITEAYTYDANGNRRTFSVTGQTLATLAFPTTSNKFTSQTGGAMSYTPAYDATGNVTSMAGIAYAYDGRNWLASTTGSAITTNYWVNDFGQRVRKTWNGSPASHVVFTYEPDGRHLGSYGLTGGVTEETVFLGDTPVGMMVGGVNYYVYADHLDAPRTVTNSSNQSRWEWDDADPFARTLPDQNPSGLGAFNWRRGFPGQFYDAEKSAWHNGFRTYHAAFGRYLQPDPIGLAGGDFSMYTYVGGNPVSFVDVWGLAPGDSYDTADEAARAAIRDINVVSNSEKAEYAGRIYRKWFGWGAYSYTPPKKGTIDTSYPGSCPFGTKNIASYHTHPGDQRYDSENFSKEDKDLSDKHGRASYLGTPSGGIIKYTPLPNKPRGGSVTIIGVVM